MHKLSGIWRTVFAPVLMQNQQVSDRDFPFRPVTIAPRADHDGRPADSGRKLNPNNK